MKLKLRRVISGKGSAPNQFRGALRGLAADRALQIYAVGDREVKVFDQEGSLQKRWPTAKFGHCLAIEPDGAVRIGQDGQVERFDPDGRRLETFRDPDRLGKVSAIALVQDQLLLGDATARCIRRYAADGKWIQDIGADNRKGGFHIPNGRLEFVVDDDQVIHAINSANHRVEHYSLDGRLLGHFGRFGMQRPEDFGGCCNPTNAALTPAGDLAVTEKAPPRLKVYDLRGRLLALVGPGAFDRNCKNMAVAADRSGRIYVADTVRLQICVFEEAECD